MTRFWMTLLFYTAPFGCGGRDSSPTAPSPSDRTFLRFEAGGRSTLVDAQPIELTPENSIFSAILFVTNGVLNQIDIDINDRNGVRRVLSMAAPDGQRLVPGRYR